MKYVVPYYTLCIGRPTFVIVRRLDTGTWVSPQRQYLQTGGAIACSELFFLNNLWVKERNSVLIKGIGMAVQCSLLVKNNCIKNCLKMYDDIILASSRI